MPIFLFYKDASVRHCRFQKFKFKNLYLLIRINYSWLLFVLFPREMEEEARSSDDEKEVGKQLKEIQDTQKKDLKKFVV